MEVVYYLNKNLGYAPVKKYFADNFDPRSIDDKRKITEVREKIAYAEGQNGRPDGNILKPVHRFGVIEIRARRDEDALIRITYFCYEGRLILLRAFEKPDHYATNKIKKEIELEYRISEEAKNDYIKNKTYEEYK